MRNLTNEDAQRLISKMRSYFGKKFTDQWAGIDPQDIEQAMIECLSGLSAEDFKRGFARMTRATFCPSLPEFRSWCEPKTDDWLGAHEAWAIAEKSVGFNGEELTVIWTQQMATAFSRCESLVKTGDKFQRAEAKKIFCDAYERLVTQAKDEGLKPKYLTTLGTDKDQQITAIQQACVDGFLTESATSALLENKQTTSELQSESLKYKTIAQRALKKLGPQLKCQTNKMTPEHKVVQDWEKQEEQHIDPFDDIEKYKQNLTHDGKEVPQVVKKWGSTLAEMVEKRKEMGRVA